MEQRVFSFQQCRLLLRLTMMVQGARCMFHVARCGTEIMLLCYEELCKLATLTAGVLSGPLLELMLLLLTCELFANLCKHI